MKVLVQAHDFSDDYLRFVAQIGADGVDIGPGAPELLPGIAEQGYADERGVRALLDRMRRWGLELWRIAPPTPARYLLGEAGGDREVDDLCRTLEVLARTGVPLMSMPIGIIPTSRDLDRATPVRGLHGHDRHGYVTGVYRGGYTMTAFEMATMRRSLHEAPPTLTVDVDTYFERCVRLYERLVPIAEASSIRLVLHPSDPPLPETPFSPRRWSQILDAAPSSHSGLLYCVGTRYESGVDIEADIHAFGRRGKIFHVHFRNVRGTLPTTGGYEEVALHDGDMNMFRVLLALRRTGYEGGLQVDHLPRYTGDDARGSQAAAYAVGYIKALLAAAEVVP